MQLSLTLQGSRAPRIDCGAEAPKNDMLYIKKHSFAAVCAVTGVPKVFLQGTRSVSSMEPKVFLLGIQQIILP